MIIQLLLVANPTKNQGKIEGAKRTLLNYFDNIEIEGIPVAFDVSEQTLNDEILISKLTGNQKISIDNKEKNIRKISLVNIVLWMIYDIMYQAYTVAISDFLMTVSTIVGMYRFDYKRNKN